MSTIITIDLDEVVDHLYGSTPEDRVARLLKSLRESSKRSPKKLADAIAAALPKPEPTGAGAVVVDDNAAVWVRADDDSAPWREYAGDRWEAWDKIPRPVRVEFEGVAR